jgi:nucleoid-associated protein YgaU
MVLAGIQPVFAQYNLPEPEFKDPLFVAVAILAAAASSDAGTVIPQEIRNNQFFLESLRLAKLAQDTYDYGDYDASTNFAQEAIRYAQLSDEYVALQLKIKETNDAIAAAKQRIDWAVSSGAAKQYPIEYSEATTYYEASLNLRSEEEWDEAISAANKVVDILAYIQAPDGSLPLPAQYTVRTWTSFRDCLWNIAGRSWAYGDPWQWKVLYNANKSKLPEPNNPDLIEPGMVLDIPSIKGEARQGMWDSGRTY